MVPQCFHSRVTTLGGTLYFSSLLRKRIIPLLQEEREFRVRLREVAYNRQLKKPTGRIYVIVERKVLIIKE